ncbi:MAG TPA: copper-binding protein [Burkholderiaceae bacterium]|nr:copper-binding protein [Burkholderiaceae bacterium]
MKVQFALAATLIACMPPAWSQTNANDHAAHHAASAPSIAAMADGEVRKIDKAQAKVTLRHGPIANLDMPSMTMVFKVADAKMLDAISEGDKVQFAADKVNGVYTVIAIKAVK